MPVQRSLFPPACELGDRETSMGPVLATARKRIIWFGLAMLGWAAVLFFRLVDLQVVRRAFFLDLARQQHEHSLEVRSTRGQILDGRGRELAASIELESIFVRPADISDPAGKAAVLARVLETPRAELLKKFSGGPKFQWVERLVSPQTAERVRALNFTGLYFQKEAKRIYPKGSMAAHVVGAVNIDQEGQAGVEQALNEPLAGLPGKMVITTDARQRSFSGAFVWSPEPGRSVMLTIDERIQYVVERELARAIERTGAPAGTIVVIQPGTGAILGIANHPGFDPNQPVRGKRNSPQEQREVLKRRNYAAEVTIEPGSTFKLITFAGALEEKLARPGEVLDCQMGSIVVAGERIGDHKPFGRLTVEQVLAYSSDVGTIKLGLRLGKERLYRYIRDFAFGRPTGIEAPGEAAGLTKPPKRWRGRSIGSISMGQEIGVTTLQLVQAVGAIANNGMLAPLRLVESTFATGEKPTPAPRRPPRRVISAETAILLKKMMEKAVLEGTGKLARLEGYTAGGKTGTAQKIDATGAYSKTDHVASFVGIAPVNNPAIVVAIVLDSPKGPHSGGGVAAPVFPRVATEVLRYLGVPADPTLRPSRVQPDARLLAELSDFNPENAHQGRLEAEAPEAPAAPMVQAPALVLAEASVPDFYGRGVRSVFEEALALGLEVDARGRGIARRQSLPAGSPAPAGARILVEFGQ